MAKITEEELIDFLNLVLRHQKKITLQDFIKRVEQAFKLDKEDLEVSNSRPSEKKYVQRCRNINCHRSFPTNVKYENEVFYLI